MKKNHYLASDEIDLFNFFKVIWEKKISFIVIVVISIVSGFILGSLNYSKENSYIVSLKLFTSKQSELIKYGSITSKLYERPEGIFKAQSFLANPTPSKNNYTYQTTYQTKVLEDFVQELMDYDEVQQVLENSPYIKKQINQLTEKDKKTVISRYAKLISLGKSEELDDKNIYFLKIKWHDPDEALQILVEILNLTSKNLSDSIFNSLKTLIEIKKNQAIDKDLNRIDYLTEQSEIAKELNIKDNQVEAVNMAENNFLLNINTNNQNVAYYLRGYKAIDKEILLIKNRKYRDLYKIESDINSLLNTETRWVYFNPILSNILKIDNDPRKKYLIISVIIGLLVGVLYVQIGSYIYLRKANEKK